MQTEPFSRLDKEPELHEELLEYCRLKTGDVWEDDVRGHRVGVLDATDPEHVQRLFGNERAALAVQDPPYNVIVGNSNTGRLSKISLSDYVAFSRKWMDNCLSILSHDSSLYVWLGADQNEHFQPLPDFMTLMRNYPELRSRSFITMRNQRGYGTQKNWMAVRQECLYYTRGDAPFHVEAEYTDIPKILRGYYKDVNGQRTENLERSKSENIRAGNVWVDVQQVFYRMQENVPGCYAQKPLKAIERIMQASSQKGDLVADFFAHAGTTLLGGELHDRKVYTMDVDPVFAEITIRRLEHFRKTGKLGWQVENPFQEVTGRVSRLEEKPEPTSQPTLF